MLINQESILDALPLIETEFGPLEYKTSYLKSGKECLDIRPVSAMLTDEGHQLSWVMSFSDSRMVVQSLINGRSVEVIEAEFDKWVYMPVSRKVRGEHRDNDLLASRVGELFTENFTLAELKTLN
jgi:hypothetical protein